jgi:hypothetical protein
MTGAKEFSVWLQAQLDARGWIQADLVKKGLNSGLISRVMSGERLPGPDTCQAIAKALGMRDYDVAFAAGIVRDVPGDTSPSAGEMLGLFNDLDDANQEEMLQIARLKVERLRKQARHARAKS